jgi:hypothetical protein
VPRLSKMPPNNAIERRRLLVTNRAFSVLRTGTIRAKQPSRSSWALGRMNSMTFTITLKREFLKRAYARRIFGDSWKLGIALIALVIGAVILFDNPETKGWALLFAGVALVGVGTLISAWLIQCRQINKWADRQGDAPVHYTVDNEWIETSSLSGSNKLKIDVFERLEVDEDTISLFYSRMGALTLPLAQVPKEAFDAIEASFIARSIPIRKKLRSLTKRWSQLR